MAHHELFEVVLHGCSGEQDRPTRPEVLQADTLFRLGVPEVVGLVIYDAVPPNRLEERRVRCRPSCGAVRRQQHMPAIRTVNRQWQGATEFSALIWIAAVHLHVDLGRELVKLAAPVL